LIVDIDGEAQTFERRVAIHATYPEVPIKPEEVASARREFLRFVANVALNPIIGARAAGDAADDI
jgi:hypothetical protein